MTLELLTRVRNLLKNAENTGKWPGWCSSCYVDAQPPTPTSTYGVRVIHSDRCELQRVLKELEAERQAALESRGWDGMGGSE